MRLASATKWLPGPTRILALGSPNNPNDHRRSLQPGELIERLQKLDIELVGLQYGADEIGIPNPGGRVADFAELAGVIAQLDLVLTVDTSVAHLAGAMGKPVWVMLPFAPDWRRMTERSDTPWYSSMRLFRQDAPGDWACVYSAVEDAISQL